MDDDDSNLTVKVKGKRGRKLTAEETYKRESENKIL